MPVPGTTSSRAERALFAFQHRLLVGHIASRPHRLLSLNILNIRTEYACHLSSEFHSLRATKKVSRFTCYKLARVMRVLEPFPRGSFPVIHGECIGT